MNPAGLVEYLETVSSALQVYDHPDRQFRCYEELMLTHGRLMPQETLPSHIRLGKPKECFSNSQDLVFASPSLTYVEGYATFNTLPIAVPHAWALTDEGKVLDPTWPQENRHYFGIAINQDWLLDLLGDRISRGRNDHRAVFEGNYQDSHSFLFDGLPEAAFAEPEMAVRADVRAMLVKDGKQQDS